MNTKLIFVAFITCTVAVAAFVAGAKEDPAAPRSGDSSPFQDATNIVFRQVLGVETNKLGQEIPKWKQFVVSNPKEISKLVSSIELAPGVRLKDEHDYDVRFQRPSGEILAHFCSHCFIIVDSQNPYRDRHYAMPKDFYTEFRRLARQQGWRVERK